MKIKKVTASDFGCLSGSYSLFDDRPSIIVEPNEKGKSTFVAAILAALYGLSPSRERKKLTEKEAYQPWKGDSYRVRLELEDDTKRSLLIDRNFGDGSVRVTDLSTNKDVTQQFRVGKDDFAIGERLLGISREVFVKTCLVRQLEIEDVGEKSSDLVSKVQQIFDTSGGKGTAAEAMRVLDEALRKYSGTQLKGAGMVGTEISRLSEEITRRRARMRELIAERERIAPSVIQLKQLRKTLEKLETGRQRLEYLSRKVEIGELESELQKDGQNRAELDKLIARKESLEPYSDFPTEEAGKLAQSAGRLEELERQRKQQHQLLEKLKNDSETTRSKLNEYQQLEGLGEDFKTHLHDLWIELDRLGQEVEKKRERLSKAEETLRKEGYDLSEMEELFRRFYDLSVGDKDLLRDSEERIPQIKAEVLELERAEEKCRSDLRAIRKPAKVLVSVGGFLCLAGIVTMILSVVGVGVGMVAAGGVAIAFALVLLPRLNMHKIQKLLGEEDGSRERRELLFQERDKLVQNLEKMARTAGFATTGQLAEAFKRWGRLQDRKMGLESQRREVDSGEKNEAFGKEKISAELKKMGWSVSPEEVNLTILTDAEKRMREYLTLSSSLSQMEERLTSVQAEIDRIERERKNVADSIRRVLVNVNLPEDTPLEEALPKIEEARQKSDEYYRIVTVWIPDKQQLFVSSERVQEMKRRLQRLKQEAEGLSLADMELRTLHPTKRHSEYAEEARKLSTQIEDRRDEKRELLQQVQVVEDNYREEYPRLANELTELSQTLDKAERFQNSISIALETLQNISARSHARWAGTLNDRANEILRHLNPRCRELKFDDDLSFTVIPAEGEMPKDQRHIEAQQSIGARHQIYLSVRLALTDYLSSGENQLPVILDDPFATSDDDRFLSGMKFLCHEFRKNHQVIVLTCHRQRHTELIRQQAPDLVEETRILQITPSV